MIKLEWTNWDEKTSILPSCKKNIRWKPLKNKKKTRNYLEKNESKQQWPQFWKIKITKMIDCQTILDCLFSQMS